MHNLWRIRILSEWFKEVSCCDTIIPILLNHSPLVLCFKSQLSRSLSLMTLYTSACACYLSYIALVQYDGHSLDLVAYLNRCINVSSLYRSPLLLSSWYKAENDIITRLECFQNIFLDFSKSNTKNDNLNILFNPISFLDEAECYFQFEFSLDLVAYSDQYFLFSNFPFWKFHDIKQKIR